MTIQDILTHTQHRPYPLPQRPWAFYQEWLDAVFLHWAVPLPVLRRWVPKSLEIEVFDGYAWISIVAFTMNKVRPRFLPNFSPISNFHEVNIRTYVKHGNHTGVYFLSMEAQKWLSATLSKGVSGLPYIHSKINRTPKNYIASNRHEKSRLHLEYHTGGRVSCKTPLDVWLTERYSLIHNTTPKHLIQYQIHHMEWPLSTLHIKGLSLEYPKFTGLLTGLPQLCHFSTGVEVVAWNKTLLN